MILSTNATIEHTIVQGKLVLMRNLIFLGTQNSFVHSSEMLVSREESDVNEIQQVFVHL